MGLILPSQSNGQKVDNYSWGCRNAEDVDSEIQRGTPYNNDIMSYQLSILGSMYLE